MVRGKVAIVLNAIGSFGGAQKRFTNLFRYLYEKYHGNIYYFVSYDLYERIKEIYKDYPFSNVFCVGPKIISNSVDVPVIEELKKTKSNLSLAGKTYKLKKNYFYQKRIFKEIYKISEKENINTFLGVASGIIPLYFYLKKRNHKVKIIFSNMDSWFNDIFEKKDLWYRKYSSYNYALENSDAIDFLSPYILKGVRERGINIEDESVSIAPCSFTDYSKCKYGNKSKFQIAFSGRLEERKNPLMFLDAAVELNKKYPDIIFHIMGKGRLSQILNDKCKIINSKNIIFHDFHPNPQEILADTSVFVSIQSTNNYPSQSVLEAMGCGNAIIASDVGDTRMFINEKNGLLINLNQNQLIQAMEKLYLKKDLCREMGEYAYKYARENHTVERCAEYYMDLFEKVSMKVNK